MGTSGSLLLRVALLPIETLHAFGAPRSALGIQNLLNREADLALRAARLSEDLYRSAGARAEGPMPPELWQARNAVLALRRGVHNRRPMRLAELERARPMLSRETIGAIGVFYDLVAALRKEQAAWEATFAAESLREKQTLGDVLRRSDFREGVWLASRSLHEALIKISKRSAESWRNEETHAAVKLLAYLDRATTKTSPNTLFAATAPARFGPEFQVSGSGRVAGARTRFNVFEARKVTACLAVDAELRPLIRPRPNPTLAFTNDTWSWWRAASLRRDDDDEALYQATRSDPLARALELAGTAGPTWPELVLRLAADQGAPAAEAERFLNQLVDRGLLIAEAEIPVLEPRPLRTLAAQVRGCGIETGWLSVLEEAESILDALPPAGSPDRLLLLVRAGEALESLPHVRALVQDELFRVDAVSDFRVEIPSAFRRELADAVHAYVRMFAGFYPYSRRDVDRQWFLDRFPADTDVSALDLYRQPFPSSSGAGVPLGALPAPSHQRNAFHDLQQIMADHARRGTSEVRLSVGAFQELVPGGPPRPWMAGALFQIVPGPTLHTSDPECRLVLNALFHGCGLALSRFHDLYDADSERQSILRTLRDGWGSLVPEGAIPAEIGYLPGGRTANACLRPRLFEHEIELPGHRASAGADPIPLLDLVVRYDTAADRFRLRSLSRHREVWPVLSSGVSPEGFAEFLAQLGRQDLLPVAFFPGLDDPEIVHWPRLTLERVVLFRERWVFGGDTGPAPALEIAREKSEARWYARLHAWRRRHGLPRRVFVAALQHGKPFYVDLESPLHTELLRRFLASMPEGDRWVVSEMLPGPEHLWLQDPGGRYASEFLVQLQGPPRTDPDGKEPR
jgi:lantibiotic biosynthesis dehydratase-like protein